MPKKPSRRPATRSSSPLSTRDFLKVAIFTGFGIGLIAAGIKSFSRPEAGGSPESAPTNTNEDDPQALALAELYINQISRLRDLQYSEGDLIDRAVKHLTTEDGRPTMVAGNVYENDGGEWIVEPFDESINVTDDQVYILPVSEDELNLDAHRAVAMHVEPGPGEITGFPAFDRLHLKGTRAAIYIDEDAQVDPDYAFLLGAHEFFHNEQNDTLIELGITDRADMNLIQEVEAYTLEGMILDQIRPGYYDSIDTELEAIKNNQGVEAFDQDFPNDVVWRIYEKLSIPYYTDSQSSGIAGLIHFNMHFRAIEMTHPDSTEQELMQLKKDIYQKIATAPRN